VSVSGRSFPLDLPSLRRAYRGGSLTPARVVESLLAAITEAPTEGVWIHLRKAEELSAEARLLERTYRPEARPALYGVPFAVKDSIDVAGVPTTVACPDFAYVPEQSAPVVERLLAAGALFVGKTNLDQFATGLVGVRSPYGIPPNPFDSRFVTGGSSSGSAAAVTRGLVSFALATDTAGSGRIPAAFNNIVGLKPSRGLFSTRGLVPACRSIDCMTLLALSCEDARDVALVATGFDPSDAFSRPEAAHFEWQSGVAARGVRLGIPRVEDLSFEGAAGKAQFERACARLEEMGSVLERIDMAPFYEAGKLLYGGPWVSERLAGLETFMQGHPSSLLPVIRSILLEGERYRATEAFRALHRLAELRRAIEPLWKRVEALVVPSAPTHPRIDEVLADPIGANARIGLYTTFGNLLDLSAVAVPAGFRPDGLPFGVTFLGSWGRDASLLSLASEFHRAMGCSLGATEWPLASSLDVPHPQPHDGRLLVAVVGAHLTGEPLNHQLTERGGRLVSPARSAPCYRLYALPGTEPPKPGLVRVGIGEGARIELEVWTLPIEAIGSFLAGVSSPLAIGMIELEDGAKVHGFLCEAYAAEGAEDISSFGGWRGFRRARGPIGSFTGATE
jgi:allophanate hydrolase